jgi:hypothetical protein
VPAVNSSWMGTFIRQYNAVDICVAGECAESGLMKHVVVQVRYLCVGTTEHGISENVQNVSRIWTTYNPLNSTADHVRT